MSSPLKKPEFSREHRLGIVVYGGVALAIYMNGICQELYNAVRGRGIYKLIKALTDADIVVDIISGTSAGGINGVLLSFALANSQGKERIKFEKLAKVWKDSGDIQKLLFQKEYDGVEKASFFNGVGYHRYKIEEALKDCSKSKEQASEDDWFSEFGELDLFVTGTDILGRIYQIFDNTGCVIDVKDHHATFHLKYRGHRDNPFKPDDITCQALAKLCQITSCFPAAFPPVTVSLDTESKNEADKKLVEWGGLKKNRILPDRKPNEDKSRSSDKRVKDIDDDPGEGYRLHFVDGGVLDNRPFSYTIKEIYHRTAERPVFRKLFYVDPNPERFQGNPMYEEMRKPDIVEVVLDSLIGMPRYESINSDLELIKEHNEKVRRYKFLLVDLEELLDKDSPDIQNKDFYDQQKNVYLRTRLISLEDKILPLIFLESEDFLKAKVRGNNRTEKLDKVAELLAKPFTDPQGSSERLKLLERLEKEICNLDVDYTLRKYFFITEYVYRLLDKDYLWQWFKNKANINQFSIREESEEILDVLVNNLKILIKSLNKYIRLIEVIKEYLDKFFTCEEIEKYFFALVDEIPTDNYNAPIAKEFTGKFYRGMLWLHGNFLNVEFPSEFNIYELSNNLKKNGQKLKKSMGELDGFLEKPVEEQFALLNRLAEVSILNKLLNRTESKLSNIYDNKLSKNPDFEIGYWNFIQSEYLNFIQRKLRKYFREFEKLDTVLYPLDYLAGISEKQLIETYRISPEDAKLGFSEKIGTSKGKGAGYKLAGDSLHAFGGFFKKSWRANDILWGRLDGLNRIVEALLTEDKIKDFPKFVERESRHENLTQAQYLDRLLEESLFPECFYKRKNQRSSDSARDEQYLRQKKDELKKKLENLFPSLKSESLGNRCPKDEPLSKELLQDFVKSLVSVGHLVILDQEFEDTIKVSIEEQLTWNQQKQLDKKSEAPKFSLRNGTFNSTITALALIKIAEESLASESLKSLEEKECFFCEHYKVGTETLDTIPKSEVRTITLRFVRIFRDILRTWRRRSQFRFIRSTRWNRFVFALVGGIVILVMEILVRRL